MSKEQANQSRIDALGTERAHREGWDLVPRVLDAEVCVVADDEASIFQSDEEALAHVVREAAAGSAYHRDALELATEGRAA